MKKQTKNLLSKKVSRRVALTSRFSNIKPKVLKKVKRLTKNSFKFAFIATLLFLFSGYYPVWSFPPVKSTHVLAADNVQTQEISASSFPQPLVLPVPGYLSTRFSNWHPGIDIATNLGTPIRPITGGSVEQINFGFLGYGNHVIVSHQNGFKSLYGHMGKIFVKVGQEVTTDTRLGEVGLTGFTSGPHTHLEITHNGRNIDPLLLLPEITEQSLPPR